MIHDILWVVYNIFNQSSPRFACTRMILQPSFLPCLQRFVSHIFVFILLSRCLVVNSHIGKSHGTYLAITVIASKKTVPNTLPTRIAISLSASLTLVSIFFIAYCFRTESVH